MKTWLVILITLGILGLMTIFHFINIANISINNEVGIKAQYEQNKNNYDNYFKAVKEMVQIPEMYIEDMKKIYDGVMQGRYGAEGSVALMQWIKEHNPQIDPQLYLKIQQKIEAGRNAFEAEQKSLIDKKAEYERFLRYPLNVPFVTLMGYPKIDLKEYGIITSDETEKIFQNKKSDPIKMRDK